MLRNYKELANEQRMLEGNMNRMCITDSFEELQRMYDFAQARIDEVYRYNVNRLKIEIENDTKLEN